jgi:hypothetical protein
MLGATGARQGPTQVQAARDRLPVHTGMRRWRAPGSRSGKCRERANGDLRARLGMGTGGCARVDLQTQAAVFGRFRIPWADVGVIRAGVEGINESGLGRFVLLSGEIRGGMSPQGRAGTAGWRAGSPVPLHSSPLLPLPPTLACPWHLLRTPSRSPSSGYPDGAHPEASGGQGQEDRGEGQVGPRPVQPSRGGAAGEVLLLLGVSGTGGTGGSEALEA